MLDEALAKVTKVEVHLLMAFFVLGRSLQRCLFNYKDSLCSLSHLTPNLLRYEEEEDVKELLGLGRQGGVKFWQSGLAFPLDFELREAKRQCVGEKEGGAIPLPYT
ncbi:hypothetical protein VNO77_05288 [Canavalia gladiata]|uniref:Uncharacterized protein n=1 Tax=Canavalia gladiata TaxID=3824 RepID=A0AAN9N3A0_CANGL